MRPCGTPAFAGPPLSDGADFVWRLRGVCGSSVLTRHALRLAEGVLRASRALRCRSWRCDKGAYGSPVLARKHRWVPKLA